jgi:hypothetical protein
MQRLEGEGVSVKLIAAHKTLTCAALQAENKLRISGFTHQVGFVNLTKQS